jgi:alpha-1,2-mannosyltransferase
MAWERRAVAVAAATPASVVVMHALAALQGTWFGPSSAENAAALVIPVTAAGIAFWIRPRSSIGLVVAGLIALALALSGVLAWGFLPLSAFMGWSVCTVAARIERALPESINGAWNRQRKKSLAWATLALIMIFQISRLSTFMADPDSAWGSTFPPVEFTVGHMCMASYVHAAELSREGDLNLYDPKHYPNFKLTEAEDIDTPVDGLQPYLDDSFHYPPPFLLLPRTWLALTNDYLVMRTVWFAAQLLAFVGFAVLLALWVGGSARVWALWLLPLVIGTMPSMFNFQFGQIHVFTIWTAMAGMLAFELKRPALGGLFLAGCIASKLFPGVLVIYLLLQKRWRDLAWTALFGAAFSALTLAVLGTVPFERFFRFLLPRLISGEAFSFVTESLVITTNLSVPGTVWKLDFLGIEGGDALLGPVSTVYTVLLLIVTWFAARLDVDRLGRVQLWLALLILASLRSPLVPIYGVAPVLWLMSLEIDRVSTVKGFAWFGISWFLISSVPPAPNPVVTIALFGASQLAMLYWVLKPFSLGRAAT